MASKKRKKSKKRVLKGRKKRSQADRGKPVRVSWEVYNFVQKYAKEKKPDGTPFKESFDSILRRLFGLPTKKGDDQSLRVFWTVPGQKKLYEDRADAAGASVLLAHKSGKRKARKPIRLKEFPYGKD